MLSRIIKIASAIIWLVGLVGYFTLPEDLPVAVGRIGWLATWLDRDTLVIALLVISSTGFAWVTFEPALRRWWQVRNEPLKIEFPNEINSVANYGPNKRSQWFVGREAARDQAFKRVTYFIGVENTTSKTIRRVSVRVLELKNPIPNFVNGDLVADTGPGLIDIRPGFTEMFLLGFRHDKDFGAEHVVIVSKDELERLRAQSREECGFQLMLDGRGTIPLLKNNGSSLIIGVYAEDHSPKQYRFTFNFKPDFELLYDGRVYG